MERDVVIIGGGVIGCSIAFRLAQAGLKVAVIERARVGREASWAAAGMLSPQADALGPGPFFDLCMRSRSMYPDFAARLREASGIDTEYRDEGTIAVLLKGEDEAWINQWAVWQMEAGLALERLSASAARELEPCVTESALGGVFIPGDHQIENRRLMTALSIAIAQSGVEVIEGRKVNALSIERGRVTGVVCDGERLSAGRVVVAAGCWSSRLLGPVGLMVQIIPARGQMIAVQNPGTSFNRVLHSSKCYVVPRLDGRILIGSTVEYVGFRKSVTAGGVQWLLAAATELVPGLRDYEIVECWSGLRPDTPDHMPTLGETGIDNLVVATGHFRNGILLAPITAELITDAVLSGRDPAELRPFSIDRFSGFKDRRCQESTV